MLIAQNITSYVSHQDEYLTPFQLLQYPALFVNTQQKYLQRRYAHTYSQVQSPSLYNHNNLPPNIEFATQYHSTRRMYEIHIFSIT